MNKLLHNLTNFVIIGVIFVSPSYAQVAPGGMADINSSYDGDIDVQNQVPDAQDGSYDIGSGHAREAYAALTPSAFPGAEGFGANSLGGRGGKIFEVVNLNDSGTGSLRACVEASGARMCVFRTGGLINLQSTLKITNPYITIAGQTAPGGGITLKTTGSGADTLDIATHDVVVRYLTFRPGPGGENHGSQIASNGVALYNIIIDHATFSWGVDSNIETWYRVYNTTIQWSIISEALDCSTHSKGCHSKGLMIGGYAGSESKNTKGSENISVLHNLMAHAGERGPLLQVCGIAQIINNVTYNPYWTFAHQQNNCPGFVSYVNWIGNYHKKGPDSTSNSDLKVIPADSGSPAGGGAQVYVQGNIGPSRTSNSQPESNWVDSGSRSFIVTTPATAPTVTTTDAQAAYNDVLADAGNDKALSCEGTWTSRRDPIDARIVNEVKNGTGSIIDDPSQVGGWITPAAGVGCIDSDHDGMPDVWEVKYGLNPNDATDGSKDTNGNGYTNVEEYFNGTDPGSSIPPTNNPTPTLTATNTATATSTLTPTLTPTPTVPTNTPTGTPTFTPTVPSNTPTFTPTIIPTMTSTPTTVSPTATNTSIPATATKTSTPNPVPPTATSTSIPATATKTSTPTPVPPTATNTSIPATAAMTSTPTPVPPTATNTSIPATDTMTSTPTTDPPTATNTSIPATGTVTPTPTADPPTATNTSIPVTATPRATSQPSKGTVYDDKDKNFVYSPGWRDVTKRQANKGSYKLTTVNGSWVTFTFTGQSFSVLYTAGPAFRKMNVYLDGRLVGTINERADDTKYQKRWNYTAGLAPGSHKLKLVFVSGASSKASGSVDAVIVR